jgi:uncharacterized protein YPO0396
MKQTMLSSLLAGMGFAPKSAPVEATALDAGVAELQTQFDAFKLESQEQLTELSTALATAVQAVEAADAKVAELQALVDAAAAEKAELQAKAVEAKAAARKEKIVAAVGTERAEAVATATEGLTDASFDAVLSAMTLSVDTESTSSLFTETGVTAEATAAKVVNAVEESPEMKILRAKYPPAV